MAILAHLILFVHGHEENTSVAAAVAYSLLFFPGLIVWFVTKIAAKEKILENWAELLLIIFIAFAFFSVGWAVLGSFSLLKGIREFALFIPYLFIFPLRDYVAEKGPDRIIWAFLAVCAISGIFSVLEYRSSLEIAKYFWQVASSRVRANAAIALGAFVILYGFVGIKKYNQLLIMALISISALAIAFTFSRGYWIVSLVGVAILAVLTKGKPRKRIVAFTLLSMVALCVAAFAIFPRLFLDLIEGLGTRLASVSLGDLSLRSRFAESAAVLHYFQKSPIIGYGLGGEFSFFNPIPYLTSHTWYIHDGYLFLLFKFGIIGTVMYLTFFGYMFVQTAVQVPGKTGYDKMLLISFVTLMIVMLIVNVTSPQFYNRGSILVLTIIWGIAAGFRKRDAESKTGGAV